MIRECVLTNFVLRICDLNISIEKSVVLFYNGCMSCFKYFIVKSINYIFVLSLFLFSMVSFVACDIYTGEVRKNIPYGSYERSYLDIYLPYRIELIDDAIPAFLLLHGGGWAAGDKSDFEDMAKAINGFGYAAVSMNYRFIQSGADYLDMLWDIKNALEYIKTYGADYKINTDKIALMGGSAGAHLALLFAYKCREDSPIEIAFAASLSGPTDFTDENYYCENYLYKDFWQNTLTGLIGGTFDKTDFPEPLLDASPIRHITNEIPYTILAYGHFDDIVPASNPERLAEVLNDCGASYRLFEFPNSGHGLDNDPDKYAETMQAIKDTATELMPLH